MAKKTAAPATMELVHRKPAELKNHPLNIKVYGDHIEPAFLEATKGGIESPLTVCQSKNPDLNEVVVKGRRRRMAAIIHEHKTVPCLLWHCDDPLEVERAMLVDNIRNETTVEERLRMYEELKRIEAGLAEQRMKATLKRGQSPAAGNSRSGENKAFSDESDEKPRSPRAKDIAAAEVDLSPKTADAGVAVIHTADALRAAGEIKKADSIIEAVNTKPMAAAVRVAAEVSAPPSSGPTDDQKHSKEIDRATSKLVGLMQQAEKTAGEFFVAIDQKKKTNRDFANRHTKFATLIRKFGELLDPLQNHASAMDVAWKAAKKQVDE